MHTHTAHILFLIIGLLRLTIAPQNGDPMAVTIAPDQVTLYETAYDAGVIGLLAHNYLAGEVFYQLEPGDRLYLNHTAYQVRQVIQYQTLNPYEFLDLETGRVLTGEEAIRAIYLDQADGTLVLQTCLEKYGDPDWGLTFWIAEAVRRSPSQIPQ